MEKISVTLLTKNSSRYLEQVLGALAPFDQVLLYDNGSTDATVEIARRFSNVEVKEGSFDGFGATHNKASAAAANDWILSVDSDELVSDALVEELAVLHLDEGVVYSVPRRNYFNGKWIRWCGWHPDRQLRLYNRKRTAFTSAEVHEQIEAKGLRCKKLNGHLVHYSYSSVSDFLEKMQLYSTLFAKQHAGKKSSSPLKAWGHGLFAFFKSYLLKRGFFGGYEGFLISAYNGHTAFYKYMKLYEENKRKR